MRVSLKYGSVIFVSFILLVFFASVFFAAYADSDQKSSEPKAIPLDLDEKDDY